MSTYQERLAKKKAKLQEELTKLEEEERRAEKNPADVVLQKMFFDSDDATRQVVACGVYKIMGDSGAAAKLLNVPTSVLHAARNYKPG